MFSMVGAVQSGGQCGLMDAIFQSPSVLIADDDEEDTLMMPDGLLPLAHLRSQDNAGLVANNALIATPCGTLVFVPIGQHIMDLFVEATNRFTLSGITKDSSGVALGSCRVVVMETGRIAVTGNAVVAETISDGSGNYSVNTPGNSAHQAIAYKPGSPDVAGITANNLIPV